jgi:catechol 2,3-dioxygenase-like lactoylglutathione lyase family enzyme
MAAAPLPLLGTFHEFSVASPDVRASVEFYERLGFSSALTSDAFTHPYGVMGDGRFAIGLHQRDAPSPILTFVRPEVARSLAAFADAGITLTRCRTGEEVFNELAFEDPGAHAVAVLEARTYSPPQSRGASACGDFAEVSLPQGDFEAARVFWESLGFVAAEESEAPYVHLALTSDYLDLAFHAPHCERAPLLVFRDADPAARLARLRERGLKVTAAPKFGPAAALLRAPEGTALLLLPPEE